jgi:endonuclease YncB( thermonuclease family)
VSKHWKPGKKTVELEGAARPSRIRRDPLLVASPADVDKKAYWRTAEWDRRFAVIGITIFALAIFVVTIGVSAIMGADDGAAAPANPLQFGRCEGGANCVIDSDTIRVAGATVQIAGMQTPQIDSPRCPEEQRRGTKAVERLIELLNSGKVTVGEAVQGTDGSLRRKVAVDGRDIAQTMIASGLAQVDDGARHGWCG